MRSITEIARSTLDLARGIGPRTQRNKLGCEDCAKPLTPNTPAEMTLLRPGADAVIAGPRPAARVRTRLRRI